MTLLYECDGCEWTHTSRDGWYRHNDDDYCPDCAVSCPRCGVMPLGATKTTYIRERDCSTLFDPYVCARCADELVSLVKVDKGHKARKIEIRFYFGQ